MISYFIEVTICWAGFYGLYVLLLSKTTFFRANRYYLIGTMLLGLLAPLMNLPTFAPEPESIPGVAYLHPVTVGAQQLEVVVTARAEDPGFNYYRLLQWIYLGGLLLFGSRFLYGLWQIRQLYREGRKEKYEGYTLVRTRKPHLPFSFFGYLFWSDRIDLEGEDGKAVLRHEQAHISDRHSFDVLLMEILCLTFWFSPFVYLYRRSLRTVHEYLADHVVLQTTGRKKYGHLLLKQSQSGLQVALANHFFQNQIKQRIMMMTRHKTSRKALLRYFLAVPLFILFLLAFANRQLIGQTLLEIHKPDGTVEQHTLKTPKEADQFVKPEQIATVEVLKNEENDKIIIRMKEVENTLPNLKEERVIKLEDSNNGTFTIKGADMSALQIEIVYPDGRVEKLSGSREEQMKKLSELAPPSDIARVANREDQAAGTNRLTVYLKGADEKQTAPSDEGASFSVKREDTEKQAMQTGPGPLKVVDQMPLFPGCEEVEDAEERRACANRRMLEYIYKKVHYSEAARKAGIEGTVVAKFIVDETGQVTQARIVRDIGGGLGEGVLKLINEMPRWTPGRHKNKVVAVEMVIPVKFELEEEYLGQIRILEKSQEKVFKVVEEMPRFPGCEDMAGSVQEKTNCANQRLLQFIYENIRYPEAAKAQGLEGAGVVSFIIGKDGSVRDAKVRRDIGGGAGEEMLRVINEMPRWIPGRQDGENVAVEFNLPVKFKLSEKEKQQAADRQLKLQQFSASPNPTDGQLQLRFQGEAAPTQVRISDLSGREIFQQNLQDFDGYYTGDIDLSKASGTLLLTIQQGERFFTEKIIVQ